MGRATGGAIASSVVGLVAVVFLPSLASATSTDHARWLFDERGGTVAADSSGFGHHGTSYHVVMDGEAFSFNGSSSRVIVPDTPTGASGALDPESADFTFGVRLSMPAPPGTGETFDVLRKGLAGVQGGNYKLEVKNSSGKAVARCVVRDSRKVSVAIQSLAKYNLAGTGVHVVTCSKTATAVTIRIDGTLPRTKAVDALRTLSNTSHLALGAKAENKVDTGLDWYLGKIHEAWVSVG